jgi:hypothetical protein
VKVTEFMAHYARDRSPRDHEQFKARAIIIETKAGTFEVRDGGDFLIIMGVEPADCMKHGIGIAVLPRSGNVVHVGFERAS